MSINKALLKDDRRLTNTIKQQGRFIRELKTPQQIGADILRVDAIPSGGTFADFGPFTITSGQRTTVAVKVTPASQTLTLWNFLHTIYVDADDTAHQFPTGSSLSFNQKNLAMATWIDWADSNDSTNVRVYKVDIRNNDSGSHDYYIRFRVYFPIDPGTS